MSRKKEIIFHFTSVIIILLFLTGIFWLTDLDLLWEGFFYREGEGWYLTDHFIWKILYNYGTYPGLILFFISFVILGLSIFVDDIKKYRKIAAFMFLLMLIGAGLIINSVFKEYWGRPRPQEVIEFGGSYKYVKPWQMGDAGENSSFPSGHAAVAFYLLSPFFLYRNIHRKRSYLFLISGLTYGLLMGLGRMIQGAHFPSDILWSGGFMYLTAAVLYYLLKLDKKLF